MSLPIVESHDCTGARDEQPCECTGAGFCWRWKKRMTSYEHGVCSGQAGEPRTREFLARVWAEHRARVLANAQDRVVPCAHLGLAVIGPDGTQATRACASCKGSAQMALRGCGIHGECTSRDCEVCPDYHAAASAIGSGVVVAIERTSGRGEADPFSGEFKLPRIESGWFLEDDRLSLLLHFRKGWWMLDALTLAGDGAFLSFQGERFTPGAPRVLSLVGVSRGVSGSYRARIGAE